MLTASRLTHLQISALFGLGVRAQAHALLIASRCEGGLGELTEPSEAPNVVVESVSVLREE
jgi:hypothetical protein